MISREEMLEMQQVRADRLAKLVAQCRQQEWPALTLVSYQSPLELFQIGGTLVFSDGTLVPFTEEMPAVLTSEQEFALEAWRKESAEIFRADFTPLLRKFLA